MIKPGCFISILFVQLSSLFNKLFRMIKNAVTAVHHTVTVCSFPSVFFT